MKVIDFKRTRWVFFLVVVLDLIFLSLPTIIVVAASLTASDVVTFPPKGFSLKWYVKLVGQGDLMAAFFRSFQVAVLCTLLAIPSGLGAALALHKYKVHWRHFWDVYFLLPFTIPLIVSGLGLLIIYGKLGLLNKVWPVGFALTVINLPFMLWAVSSSINALDQNLEYAAQNLGAEGIQTFIYVTLPALMPGVITGSLIMFILGFNEFIVSLLLTTIHNMTLPVKIYNSIRAVIEPTLAAISSVYIVLAMVVIWILDRVVGLEEFLRAK